MAEKVKDLVCGMEFDRESASGSLEYTGKIYYFCSLGCRDKFADKPEKYVAHKSSEVS